MPCPRAAGLTQVASLQVASEKYQEGEQALREARQVQSEHQARLQLVQQQLERLQQQEQHVHQARLPPAPTQLLLPHLAPPTPPLQTLTAVSFSPGTGGRSV